ncbi:MAG: ABC-2 type transporter [bacterium ADurb.Bin236]|nr:MAG: ABC-2 type transporter [bacterium ADurb.Bin236]HOY62089.1 ABC transporter permease [bacterium]HPN95090.1 ABC transporter permease [bacterium]
MKTAAWKILVLIRRDFLEEVSYRLKFFLDLATILMFTSIFFFIARAFEGATPKFLEKYGGDYFSFVLIGLALSGFLNVGMYSFSATVRNEQTLGTLEALMASPTSPSLLFTARLLWSFIYGSFHLAAYLAIGILLLSASYNDPNWAAIPVIIILSFAAFNSIGLMSAAFTLMFKRGDPISALIGFGATLLSGVFFPVEALPAALQKISAFIPMTYTLRLMRDACINGASFAELGNDLAILAALGAVLVPASAAFFAAALRRVKRDGSLSHY